MDFLGIAVPSLLGMVSVATTALVGKVVNTERTITAHVAADDVHFANINANFADIKAAQHDQTEKIDYLVKLLLERR